MDEEIKPIIEDLNRCFQRGDDQGVVFNLRILVQKAGIRKVARKMGISRASLYKATDYKANPTIKTWFPIIKALGLGLQAERCEEEK